VGMAATPGPKALGLVATLGPKALNVGLTTKSCHESMITK